MSDTSPISFRVTPDERQHLQGLAQAEGLTLSNYVRKQLLGAAPYKTSRAYYNASTSDDARLSNLEGQVKALAAVINRKGEHGDHHT
jgi:hypothetical protein